MKKGLRRGLIIASLIIVCGGTVFGIAMVATWDEYDDSYVFYYKPETPASIERISINTDIGKINVKYNTTPTDYYVRIDADIHVVGPFVKEKSFSDFFKPIVWINESTAVVKFSLESKPMSWIMFIGGSKIKINVTLRTDVIYNINAEATTGAVEATIPNNTILDQINLEATTGSVELFANGVNFTNNLRAIATTGSVKLNFTNCILEDSDPEFTPEHAKEAIATVLMGYLSAKRGSPVTRDDLMEVYKKKGTKSILEGLEKYVKNNYCGE